MLAKFQISSCLCWITCYPSTTTLSQQQCDFSPESTVHLWGNGSSAQAIWLWILYIPPTKSHYLFPPPFSKFEGGNLGLLCSWELSPQKRKYWDKNPYCIRYQESSRTQNMEKCGYLSLLLPSLPTPAHHFAKASSCTAHALALRRLLVTPFLLQEELTPEIIHSIY